MKQNDKFTVCFDNLSEKGMISALLDEGEIRIKDKEIKLGDICGVLITNKKNDYFKAKVLNKVKDAEGVRNPLCKHFLQCGGCVIQYLPYEKQLFYKERFVNKYLANFGKIEEIIGSPEEFAYRNKVEFSFGYEEMKSYKDEDGRKILEDINPTVGFHKQDKWWEIANVNRCELISKNANNVFSTLKDWCLNKSGKQVYNTKAHKGFFKQLLIRENKNGDIMVNLVIHEDYEKGFFDTIIQELVKLSVVSFFVTVHKGWNDSWNEGNVECIHGEKYILENILECDFEISPQSFFQTNTKGTEVLYRNIIDIVNDIKPNKILDLYCGTGSIGIIIAKNIDNINVEGIEIIKEAILDAKKNADRNNIKNIEFKVGKSEDIIDINNKYDLIITDPPRGGMHPKAIKKLKELNTDYIVYVSCNPVTLARDLDLLIDEYKIQKIQPIDMFPQTYHIENIVLLKKI